MRSGGPCKLFTPQLKSAYSELKSLPLADLAEVIFVSRDHDQEGFDTYYSSMPWLAVKFEEDSELVEHIKSECGIKTIPHLAVFKPTPGSKPEELKFTAITQNGRSEVAEKKVEAFHGWIQEAKNDSAFTTDEDF